MIFLGSVKLDKSKRLTLIKEVADILQADEKDHIMFYIDNGEIVIRKNIEKNSEKFIPKDLDFWEWVRKREIEIALMEDENAIDIAKDELEYRKERVLEMEKAITDMMKTS